MNGWMDWETEWDKTHLSSRYAQDSALALEVRWCDLPYPGLELGKL